jgi:hypothetical protein
MSKADDQLQELIEKAIRKDPMWRLGEPDATVLAERILAALHERAHGPEKGGWLFVAQGAHLVTEYHREWWNDEHVVWEVATVADEEEEDVRT